MTEPTRVAETHISTLLFVDDVVIKRKKPVRTAFLDFSTVALRRAACHREVELNRRLAPDVYLGVLDVSMAGDELDHAVLMRRLPPERRLANRLESPTADDDLRQLAHLLATFHAAAQRSGAIDAASGHDAVVGLWEAELEQIDRWAGPEGPLERDEVDRVGALALTFLAGRGALLDDRVTDGRACDGHGDLQAEDIFLLDDGPRVLDCIEFDDRLRYGDALADVAFLAMDIERLGHPELAARFLDLYRELSGDRWPVSLAHLHIAYRAHVRAKVACIRHDQGDPHAASAARDLHRLALRHLEAGCVRLILVGGSPGTGKSTVAAALGDRLGAVVLSTDEVRDDVSPVAPGEPRGAALGAGRYRPEVVRRTYEEVLRRTGVLLAGGHTVVLDASWLDPDRRHDARELARELASEVHELRCACPEKVAAERIDARLHGTPGSSDATAEVAAALAADAAPWPEATELDTTRLIGELVAAAEAIVA